MTDFVIKCPTQVWDDINPQPQQSVLVKEWNDGAGQQAYLYTTLDADPLPDWPVGSTVMGAWDRDTGLQMGESYDTNEPPNVIGSPTYPIDPEYWTEVNVLGNEAGRATGYLRTTKWQGHSEEKYAVADTSEYPVSDAPCQLLIERQEYVAPDPFPGWAWVVKQVKADPSRPITNRAIWVYSDPDFEVYSYTTAAFQNDGKYGDVFYSECPEGQRTVTPDPVYFGLHEASNPAEGLFELIGTEVGDTAEALFWKQSAVGGAPWSAGVDYTVGIEATYADILYSCLQAHTSQPGWEPPNVPALWAVV